MAQGGTLNIATVTNAGTITVASASTLAGGTIISSGRIEGGGNIGNAINNSGVIEPLAAATLTVTGTLTNAAAGTISLPAGTTIQNLSGFTVNDGTISLAGGTFTKTGALTNNGSITGRGTIQTGGLTNEGTLDFTAGTTTINGAVINNDTVRTTNATITFNGTYTENGTLHSDPSDHFFATLNVGIAGKIEAGAGDRFFINGNFSNGSTQALTWDTTVAELVFQNGPAHTFALAGRDLGASYAGFTDNFEWGTFRLQTGQSLSLSDGNATAGAAFYAAAVVLAGGTAQIPSITGNGFNIYYDAANSANAYLANRLLSPDRWRFSHSRARAIGRSHARARRRSHILPKSARCEAAGTFVLSVRNWGTDFQPVLLKRQAGCPSAPQPGRLCPRGLTFS